MNKYKIIKTQYDKREYECFTLPNKMQVLLISDPDIATNCISMMVNVGYLYDTFAGIAHFLEHMLFMGTKKFPEEAFFHEFILKHGGYTNAFTTLENTCYYYTIQHKYIEESLDIFSQFFIEPLLKSSAINRELTAVHSEHEKNINDDNWRHEEILKVICLPDHTYKNFGTGNYSTLKSPKLEQHVRDFYNSYYSSDRMTLMIIGNDNLATLKAYIIKYFSDITIKKSTLKLESRMTGKILNYPASIKIVPIKNLEKLILNWELPFLHDIIPLNFLLHILGHESQNTLHHILTHNNYISNLTVELNDRIGDKCIIKIAILLTSKGSKNRNLIINSIYYYINNIKKYIDSTLINKLYDEYCLMQQINFIYVKTHDASLTLMNFNKIYITYLCPLHKLLSIFVPLKTFDEIKPKLLLLLNLLEPEKSIVIHSSSNFKKNKNLITEHYKINYTFEHNYVKYDETLIEIIKKQFALPILNPYIPNNFHFINSQIATKKPILLDTNIFWKPDISFNSPLINIHVCINIPNIIKSVETHVKGVLYFNSIINMINHQIYLCNMANYIVSISNVDDRLYIVIEGFEDKIIQVCKLVINALLSKLIDEPTFTSTKFQLKKSDENNIHKNPYIKVNDIFLKRIMNTYYDSHDRLKIINTITRDQTINIIDTILELTSCKMLISGNVDNCKALEISKLFSVFTSKKTYKPSIYVLNTIDNIITSEPPIIKTCDTIYETNVAVAYHIELLKLQIGKTKNWNKNFCIIQILDTIIGDKYFDTLRTQEEFGYVVNGSCREFGDPRYITYFYKYLVQSPSHTIDEIIDRTTLFIDDFLNILNKLDKQTFDAYILGCITPLSYPFSNITDLSEYYFSQIEQEYYNFNLNDVLIRTFKIIEKNDIIEFYKKIFMKHRKSIIVACDKYHKK